MLDKPKKLKKKRKVTEEKIKRNERLNDLIVYKEGDVVIWDDLYEMQIEEPTSGQ